MDDKTGGMAAVVEMLRDSSWHRRVMEVVAGCGAPDAWIAAGAIRDLVWDERFGGGFEPGNVKDVDVVYFDPGDLRPERDARVESALRQRAQDVPWEAKNQAAVHLWYPSRFGLEVEPLASVADAVATFPETASAVAARLVGDAVEVLAPLGVGDLLAGIWRRNPRRVSEEEARARIERKAPERRWPSVTVIAP